MGVVPAKCIARDFERNAGRLLQVREAAAPAGKLEERAFFLGRAAKAARSETFGKRECAALWMAIAEYGPRRQHDGRCGPVERSIHAENGRKMKKAPPHPSALPLLPLGPGGVHVSESARP